MQERSNRQRAQPHVLRLEKCYNTLFPSYVLGVPWKTWDIPNDNMHTGTDKLVTHNLFEERQLLSCVFQMPRMSDIGPSLSSVRMWQRMRSWSVFLNRTYALRYTSRENVQESTIT